MQKNQRSWLYILACLLLFVLLGFIYANPVLSGQKLFQHDIIQYKGGAKELLDYREAHGKETYWSNSMFGGMPTYQMGARFSGDVINKIDDVLNIFPKPVNYLFTLFAGFFLLGMVAVRNWKYALLGALFFGLSTYFYIIIAAGHNGKVHTISYFAPLLAGILLVYIRKKYLLGFIITALFMGLQVAANHPQMTYYLFIALAFLFISELIRAIQKKSSWKHFLISTGIVGIACALGVGMNAQRLMANAEYVTETVRGKKILQDEGGSSAKSGMDKESMLMWSYGKMETLNLLIPRLMGGASDEPGSEKMMQEISQIVQENVKSENELQNIYRGLQSPTYWGEQPGTSGPAYQGAVVIFLAFLGFFFAPKNYRYWILAATILTIMLAWGSNLMWLSDFFIEFVPLYNKFRAPSSILVVPELLLPLIAMVGLYYFFQLNENQMVTKNIELKSEAESNAKFINLKENPKAKTLFFLTAGFVGFLLLLMIFGKPILGFYSENEKTYLPPYLLDYLIDERYKMFQADTLKAIIYIVITAAAMLLAVSKKISGNVALIIIALVSTFDLWTVNRRYLNNDNFVEKVFADHPFQTEFDERMMENPKLEPLLASIEINKRLEEITEKDQNHYRIYNQALGTFSETNTSYFKSSVGGYSAAKLRRYDDLIGKYFSPKDSIEEKKTLEILNMLNAKYFVLGTESGHVIANPNNNGNAWLVSDVQFANTPNEEIEKIGEIDTKKFAIISANDKEYFNGKNLQRDSLASIQLTSYQPNELHFKTNSSTSQLAIFSEIFYPHGWKMFLDGEEVPYIKANYLLRALHIPAGKHDVKMIFEPEVLQRGKLFSWISFGLFLALSLAGIFYFRKQKNFAK